MSSSPALRSLRCVRFPIISTPRTSSSSARISTARFSSHSSSYHCSARNGCTSSTSTRTYTTGPNARPGPSPSQQSPFRVWPFVAIVLLGSGAYVLMVKQRTGMAATTKATTAGKPASDMTTSEAPQLAAPAKSTPAFSPPAVTVLFVLGGPGAGKGTQCANLVRDYGFTHLSAGDLLRAEQERPGSEFGALIKHHIAEGVIVPMEITVQLLENAMGEVIRGEGKQAEKREDKQADQPDQPDQPGKQTGRGARFLIDGFPRKMDQALRFEEAVCPARGVLFFECDEQTMLRRLLHRGETSGRADDNRESIVKRFRVFQDTSMPVVDYFARQDRVVRVDGTRAPDDVYAATKRALEEKLGRDF